MSDDELKRLIIHADLPQYVEICCREAYGQLRFFMAPLHAKEALQRGLIEVLSGEVVDSPRCYTAEIMLTESGREFCGIERLNTAAPEPPKKKTTKQMEMF